jgi:NAD(P)-dependent dehydrogenase (short-subunit alcohol dehydrogenase family)
MNIANKSVLITGANRGIGRALLNEALRRGAKKVYAGTRSALQPPDKRVTPLTLDVTSSSQIRQAADEIKTLDVLINAGVAIYDDLSNLEVIEQHLAVNLLGLLKVTRAFLPALKHSKGAIINNLIPGRTRALAGHSLLLPFEGGRAQPDAVAESALGGPRRDGPCRRSGPG